MSDEMIVRYCSPTLANIKTANLFSCLYSSKQHKSEISAKRDPSSPDPYVKA